MNPDAFFSPFSGSHGPEPPGDILARLRPALAAAGITRIAVLTGLDTLGVPVAAAIRPNSRSIAVHQGKGATLDAAKLGAVMEAIECASAERIDLPLTLGTAEDMAERGAVLDIAALPRARGGGDPLARRLLWVEGEDLLAGGKVWVPRELVAADWTWPPVPGEPCFQASTNGLGAGLTVEAATRHALHEVIERDAVAIWRARPAASRAATSVDPFSVDGQASRALLDRLAGRGATVTIWDATSDVGVSTVLVLLADAAGRLSPELGAGCHADPDAALFRALTEAAQSRLTVISGARDDFSDADYAPDRKAHSLPAARPGGPFAAMRGTAGAEIADVLRALAGAGVRQVARVDLSRPELHPARVVRVVVPGLEGGHTDADGEYVPGPRARNAR